MSIVESGCAPLCTNQPTVCQALRIVTFSVTQLPGPSFHCRASEPGARRAWPAHWTGHFIVDVGRQVSKSCGDLIFSSHTTFMLTGTHNEGRDALSDNSIQYVTAGLACEHGRLTPVETL